MSLQPFLDQIPPYDPDNLYPMDTEGAQTPADMKQYFQTWLQKTDGSTSLLFGGRQLPIVAQFHRLSCQHYVVVDLDAGVFVFVMEVAGNRNQIGASEAVYDALLTSVADYFFNVVGMRR